jgi:predicted ATPase
MQHLGLVDSLSTKSENKLGISLYLTTEGVTRPLDLTSVGFGTSQVLPIIVQGLLTPAGGTFIVEQPEVHLHPKLQSKLAYFFYALTKANVQCIVETHSDHIINQLRVLVAEEDIRKHVCIYFAQRDIASGTKFEKVVLGRNGNIQNWPADFLSEGSKLTRELLNAARTASES